MSNGYLLAAAVDRAAADELAAGFGLDVIDATADHEATMAALATAPNVGLLLSEAAAHDQAFVALLNRIATRVERAQLIVMSGRDAFSFLPAGWPVMSFEDAHARATALVRSHQPEAPSTEDERAHPLPPTNESEPAPQEPQAPPQPEEPPELLGGATEDVTTEQEEAASEAPPAPTEPAPELDGAPLEEEAGETLEQDASADGEDQADEKARAIDIEEPPPLAAEPEAPPALAQEEASAAPPPAEPPAEPPAAPPSISAPEAPPQPAPIPAGPPIRERREEDAAPAPMPVPRTDESFGSTVDMHSSTARSHTGVDRLGETAPADATAFAPSKLRRGEPELVRIAVHQPKDLNAVIKAAKKIDPRTEPAPQGMPVGDIALGAKIGVALEVRGATCDGTLQRREWRGEPIDFNFAVEADASVKQVVMLARVFVNDAQIGVLAFTRKVSGPAKKPHGPGDRARLKRHRRVFLSYSSQDRETVSAIATAYQMAGVEHFWDRASLKSGEEWHPRLRREIDRADLFHLCWSKNAAQSEWVQKEAEHALTRRRKQSGKPEITVQMLDGPPWAAHPPELDSINFDDFVRAAVVGYARGDGS